MSSHSSTYPHNASQCCGVQISFYELCGHTLTLTDHSTTCTHSNPFLTPPPPAHIRPRRGLPSSPRPKPSLEQQLTTIPDHQLKCIDLHRFIRFTPKSCTCTNPLDKTETYPSPPTRSDPHHDVIPKAIIFQRRMHFLHLAHLDHTAAQNARKLEMSQFIKKCREWEEKMRVPFSGRTFIYDPSGIVGDFFQKVDVDKLRGREKTCAICRKLVSEERSRRLPCGCVLDLECVVGWMRERKDCALCGRLFRLIKKACVNGEVECECSTWENDVGAEFI